MSIYSSQMADEHIIMLSSAWMFVGISAVDIAALCKKISIKQFPSDCTVLRDEDACQVMYVVLQGKVKAVSVDKNGVETILAIHGEGESFGEIALIDGKTSPASIITLEHSKLALISKKQFYSLLSSHSAIMFNVMSMLCSNLRAAWANNRIMGGSHKSAVEKIQRMLLNLSRNHGVETPIGMLIDIKLTHQSLAAMTGLTRAYLTRTLAGLQKSGIISVIKTDKGKRILIKKA